MHLHNKAFLNNLNRSSNLYFLENIGLSLFVHSYTSKMSSIVASWIDSLFPESYTRHGKYRCHCGAVQATICIPPSSYIIVDQNNARCHCHDCVDFVKACGPHGKALVDNYSTHMVNFYKSDLTITQGQDKIGAIQQHPHSILVRTICIECGTPLGCDLPSAPMTLLYPQNMTSGPIYTEQVIIFRKFAPPQARSYHRPGLATRQNMNSAILFMLRIAARVILGFVLGKNKGGLLTMNYDNILQGKEHLPTLLTKHQMKEPKKTK